MIGPWNYPIFTPLGSLSFALAAGNTVVYKPSEYTPGVGVWLAQTLSEVVPEHPVLQVVTGDGSTGAALCRSGVDKIGFTGSTATGKQVMTACAETLTPVLMECGGKDALIVDADGDLDAAADAAVWGGFSNAGQTCLGVERVYVHEKVFDAFVDRVVTRARAIRAGSGGNAQIGPITMPTHIDVIRRHIDDAIGRGWPRCTRRVGRHRGQPRAADHSGGRAGGQCRGHRGDIRADHDRDQGAGYGRRGRPNQCEPIRIGAEHLLPPTRRGDRDENPHRRSVGQFVRHVRRRPPACRWVVSVIPDSAGSTALTG